MPDGAIALNPWTALAALLITSGFGKYLIDLYRERAQRRASAPPATPARQAEIDQSMLAMARANEQLEDDNTRLRASNVELNTILSDERTGRATDRENYQREIRTLEGKLREMSSEIAELLRQVGTLRQRHDTGPNRTVGPGESRSSYQLRED